MQLRPIGGELGIGQPLTEELERLFLEGGVRFDAAKSLGGLGQQLHSATSS